MKPVIYLDIDDTLLRFPPDGSAQWWSENKHGGPAKDARAFLVWATEHCEVRWLTFWFARGYPDAESLSLLARRLGVTEELLRPIRNPMGWDGNDKTTGINWEEHHAGRLWVWIEDECRECERAVLRSHKAEHRFIQTNSSEDADALTKAWGIARARLALEEAR